MPSSIDAAALAMSEVSPLHSSWHVVVVMSLCLQL